MPTSTQRYKPFFTIPFGEFDSAKWGDAHIAPYAVLERFM